MPIHCDQIAFQDTSCIEILDDSIQGFLLFSIPKNNKVKKLSTKVKFNDAHDTFLLLKRSSMTDTQKNIVFVRKGHQITKNSRHESVDLENQPVRFKQESFHATYFRHVNIIYFKKLAEFLEISHQKIDADFSTSCLMLYEVQNFYPAKGKSKNECLFQIATPEYGESCQIYTPQQQRQKIAKLPTMVCNLFQFESEVFYFLAIPFEIFERKFSLNLVQDSIDKKKCLGFTFRINKENLICIPFQTILFEQSPEIKISRQIAPKLERTCYVEFMGSYCTGILVQTHIVISTRHILPLEHHKLSTQVNIRRYPYRSIESGKVTKIGLGSFDFIQIQIFPSVMGNSTETNQLQNRTKQIVRHDLIQTISQRGLQSYDQPQKYSLDMDSGERNCDTHLQIGKQIVAVGFGKMYFYPNIFCKLETVLPTLAAGVISKLISFDSGKNCFFIKTDAKLYGGFSGSGVWQSDSVIAMAVFILKNKTNHSHYNRHNFSYNIDFLHKILLLSGKRQIQLQFDGQIRKFDKIQSRQKFQFIKLPESKL